MTDPYRTTAADARQVPPPRPYKVISFNWDERGDDWRDAMELVLLEWHHSGYDVVSMTEDSDRNDYTFLLRYRGP